MTQREKHWTEPLLGLLRNNPGDAVYGAIAVGALLAAESARQESYARTVLAVLITLVLYWLAHSYADLAGERLRTGARLTVGRLLSTMAHEIPILIGAALPLMTLFLCWLVGAGLGTAVRAAIWTSFGIIVAIEVVAGVRGELGARQMLGQAAIGALLGALILLLRVVLH